MLARLQCIPSNFCIKYPRCNARRTSSSCSKLQQVAQAQPERARVATQAGGDASTQTDPQLQGSPRVLRRQNAMRRRQAQPSPPPSPSPPQQQPQQLPLGELGDSQCQVQQQQQQTGRRTSSGRQQQHQQHQHQQNQRQQAGPYRGKRNKAVGSKRGLRGSTAAQGIKRGGKTTSQARAEELGAPKGSTLATRLSQLLEEEAEDEESDSEGGNGEVFGGEEVERLVFGAMDFSVAPQSQGQTLHTATGSDLEACRTALLQPSTTSTTSTTNIANSSKAPSAPASSSTTSTTTNSTAPPGPANSGTASTATNSSAPPAPADSAATSSAPAPVDSAAVPGATQKQQQVSAIPVAVAEMALAAAQGGLVAAVPESLLARTRHLMSAAGGREERVLQAVRRLREEVGGMGKQTVTEVEAMAALLLVPNVINLNEQDIRARMTALLDPGLLGKGTTMESLTPLVLSHPELLVAPLNALQSKLTTFRNLMDLTGEAAVAMLNPYMFEGCS